MEYILTALALSVVYYLCVLFYRLYLSPLARFPGPKLAAATGWYNAYYDLGLGGQYVWQVKDMHEKYGPIVRTRPDTLHVNDPRFVDKLYSSSPKRRRERHDTLLKMMQSPGSILATRDHDLHRKRRAVLNPYFSQSNVRRLEPLINSTLADLLGRMDGWARDGKPVEMNRAFRAATKDVIQAYCFGDGEKCLDMDDCNAAFFDVMTPQRVIHLGPHFRWLAVLLNNLPLKIMLMLVPRVGVFAEFVQGLIRQVEEIRNAQEKPEGRTVFHELLQSPQLPESEKQTMRLADEAMAIVIAGSETTASTLAALVYHILADRQIFDRLRAELEGAISGQYDLPRASKLDSLPFLNALIEECLRLYPGATHRQDRVAPDEDLIYEYEDGRQLVIPAGTGVGMTAPLLNRHPSLYDRPDDFLPDRHIKNPSLSRHIFSFSKGTRQCIGMHLAYQELQSFTAGIFRRYDMYDPTKGEKGQSGPTLQLFETVRRDVEMDADFVTPAQYAGSQGLRLSIRT